MRAALIAGLVLLGSVAPSAGTADESPTLELFDWDPLPDEVSLWIRDAGATDGWAPWPVDVAPRTADGRDRLEDGPTRPWDRLEFPAPPGVPLGWLGTLPPGCDRAAIRGLARPGESPQLLVCPGPPPADRRPAIEARPWTLDGDLRDARIATPTGALGQPMRSGLEIDLAILGRPKRMTGRDLVAVDGADSRNGRTDRARRRWDLPVGSAGAPRLVEEVAAGPDGLTWRLRIWFAEGVRGLHGSLVWRPPIAVGGICPPPAPDGELVPVACARVADDPTARLEFRATAELAAEIEAEPDAPMVGVRRLENLPAGEHRLELRLVRAGTPPPRVDWQVRRIR